MRPLPHSQHEIVNRLATGERIAGPRKVVRSNRFGTWRETRLWTWRDGKAVHAGSVNAVLVKGLAEIRPADDAERELVLREAG